MAETLGSLIDKLTIKDLRAYHLQEMIDSGRSAFSKDELCRKMVTLQKQKKQLREEIEDFVIRAASGKIPLKDEKLKLYNPKDQMGRIPELRSVAEAISALSAKNAQLWHLEDEARRKDVTLSFIGSVKRKIDLANQQRNDLIDKIDSLLEMSLRKKTGK